jgi:hypothetical protein
MSGMMDLEEFEAAGMDLKCTGAGLGGFGAVKMCVKRYIKYT